jgi:hypothetical protein
MTITARAQTPLGTYPITVTGKGDGITEATTLSLTVVAAGKSVESGDIFDSAHDEYLRTLAGVTNRVERIRRQVTVRLVAGL